MRPKHRRAKLKKHEKKVYPNGYYEKLLWFIVSDAVESEDINEITTRYLRAWDDIWHTKNATGKPGRPAIDESQRLRQMNALLNATPGLKPNTAAKRVVTDTSLSAEARANLVRKLVRHYNSACKNQAAVPNKNEKFIPKSTVLSWIDKETLMKDGAEFWERHGPTFLDSFLTDIEKALKA